MRTITTAVAMCAALPAFAEVVPPKSVMFDEHGSVEVSLTGVPGDSVSGREVMVTRGLGNCVACHRVTALEDVPFHGEVGPSLDGVGSRWTEADLRGIVVNAKRAFEGTIMPAFYKDAGFVRPGDAYTGKAAPDPENMPTILSAQQVEDVVAYLLTLEDG